MEAAEWVGKRNMEAAERGGQRRMEAAERGMGGQQTARATATWATAWATTT